MKEYTYAELELYENSWYHLHEVEFGTKYQNI